MKQIDRRAYFMGRENIYATELTPEIDANADVTIDRVNQILTWAQADGVELEDNPKSGSIVSSGWRPANVNKNVPNAAPKSKHLTAQACDIYDPEGVLDDWCLANLDRLTAVEVWLEHPAATKTWCHLQIIPPRSGNRCFYP